MNRPSKDDYYLNLALETSKRSPCLRRHFGAIIVKDDAIISTGYNGPARGAPNCFDYGCLKDKNKINAGKGYDYCRAGPLHAEVNSIINAARKNGGVLGATIYIAGEYTEKSKGLSNAHPCIICKKEIVGVGIERVVIRLADGGIESFSVKDWVEEAWNTEDKDIKSFY